MAKPVTRSEMIERLRAAAAHEARIAGMVDYGSTGEGRGDEWSDVDCAVFIRDADFEAFDRDWTVWAAGFGDLLLAYRGYIGHPWCVYDASPLPLRVDFDFHRESAIEGVLAWPNSPRRVEDMVWHDATDGRLSGVVARMAGRDTRPDDPGAMFDSVCGDFWYFSLMALSKLKRGDVLTAHFLFGSMVMQHLYLLLRFETGLLHDWVAAKGPERLVETLSADRIELLRRCTPSMDAASVVEALRVASALARQACAIVASREGWSWPVRVADATDAAIDTMTAGH